MYRAHPLYDFLNIRDSRLLTMYMLPFQGFNDINDRC